MTGTGWLISIVLSYISGSIPFGVLLAKTRGINIRQEGSKNIGATNVTRVLGKRFGITCFVLDVLKGSLPVLIVGLMTGLYGMNIDQIPSSDMLLWLAVALAALIGHMYSMWLKFGGGKGVATTFGGMVAMWPLLTIPVVVAFVAWIVTLKVWKIVSLASIVAAASLPISTMCWIIMHSDRVSFFQPWPLLVMTSSIATMVFWKHRANIRRILHQQEPKIGSTSPDHFTHV